MTNFFRTSFAAAGLAIAATAFTFGLSAGPAMAQPSVKVAVSAADFATPAARDALNSRIERAARQVCVNGSQFGAQGHLERKACLEAALRQSTEQLATLKSSQVQMASR